MKSYKSIIIITFLTVAASASAQPVTVNYTSGYGQRTVPVGSTVRLGVMDAGQFECIHSTSERTIFGQSGHFAASFRASAEIIGEQLYLQVLTPAGSAIYMSPQWVVEPNGIGNFAIDSDQITQSLDGSFGRDALFVGDVQVVARPASAMRHQPLESPASSAPLAPSRSVVSQD